MHAVINWVEYIILPIWKTNMFVKVNPLPNYGVNNNDNKKNHRLASSKWPNLGQSSNMEGTYISLEPKWPLVWMQKAFFWRVQAPKIEDK